MKIVIKPGRTVHHAAKPGTAPDKDGNGGARPVVTVHKPQSIVDLPDADAKALIARGVATKYEPPKAEEPAKTDPPK